MDISNNFFDELLKLQKSLPKMAFSVIKNENSDFTNFTDGCKNCYLLTNAWNDEDCLYGRSLAYNQDCVDCDKVMHSTLCYECLDCENCYNSAFLQWCEDCRDCEYGYDLKGCEKCFCSSGLRHKQFYVFNQPYSQEEYKAKVAELKRDRKGTESRFLELKKDSPRLYANNVNAENCIGDYIRNSKDLFNCYVMQGCQDCFHSLECVDAHDLCDTEFCEYGMFNYECISAWKLSNSSYCTFCWESSDLEYCEYVMRSTNCFGCVYLNHREYCILNKQYSPNEYFELKAQIKEKMKKDGIYGKKLLPSTYPYKDTVAAMY